MDGLAFALAAFGLFLASQGHWVVGAALYVLPPVLLALSLARRARLPLILPFSFASQLALLALAMVASVSFRQGVFVGVAVFYTACVALVEGQVRYVRWGAGFMWRTAGRSERPFVYWAVVALFLALSTGLLVLQFLAAAGFVGREVARSSA